VGKIYVGLDVQKESWSVSIHSQQCEHKTFTQPPEVETLVHYLQRQFPGAFYSSVYEAGYCGFWIHDQLRAKGIPCLVVNPADVPTKDKEREHFSIRVITRRLTAGRWWPAMASNT
jgi:transposase